MSNHHKGPHKTLAWIDLETTGLDEANDAILEIGLVITPGPEHDPDATEPDLGILHKQSWVVKPTRNTKIKDIDPYVWDMHNKSNLWKESLSSHLCLADAVLEIQAAMESWDALGSPMCGNSVHFDRKFLDWQGKELLSCFHYRNLDVSSIKNMLLLHFPHLPKWEPDTKPEHRAIADLENSIGEYKHYLKHLGALNECGNPNHPSCACMR